MTRLTGGFPPGAERGRAVLSLFSHGDMASALGGEDTNGVAQAHSRMKGWVNRLALPVVSGAQGPGYACGAGHGWRRREGQMAFAG